MIKVLMLSFVALVGLALFQASPVTADGCQGAATVGCAGTVHEVTLRRGQVRRMERQSRRQQRRAMRGRCGGATITIESAYDCCH